MDADGEGGDEARQRRHEEGLPDARESVDLRSHGEGGQKDCCEAEHLHPANQVQTVPDVHELGFPVRLRVGEMLPQDPTRQPGEPEEPRGVCDEEQGDGPGRGVREWSGSRFMSPGWGRLTGQTRADRHTRCPTPANHRLATPGRRTGALALESGGSPRPSGPPPSSSPWMEASRPEAAAPRCTFSFSTRSLTRPQPRPWDRTGENAG